MSTPPPDERSAHYVVLPDRSFYAVVGPGADRRALAPAPIRLSHEQLAAIHRATRVSDLFQSDVEATQAELPADVVVYDVELILEERRLRVIRPAEEAPGIRRLVELLAATAGLQ